MLLTEWMTEVSGNGQVKIGNICIFICVFVKLIF